MKITAIAIPHHNREVYGMLYEPEGTEHCPIVIFSHGFNGSGEHFTYHAKLLAQNGIAAITYDFCGCSVTYKGSMKSTDMTIFTEKEDLEAVLDYACGIERADTNHIYLFGASQGGFVTALTAAEHNKIPAGVLLLYPALCIPDDWNTRFPELSDIPDTYELWGVQLGRGFFETMHDFSVYDKIKGYQGPVFVMHGDKDPVVNVDDSRKLFEIYQNLRLEVFEGEGHGFTRAGDRRVAGLTLDFVRNNGERV
ncbi:MAG: alpha/beta hydrolase [Lachnospiraceae bacterium]|nr:alpha/beta hydrolase [Lachnospiraceae bacterium]